MKQFSEYLEAVKKPEKSKAEKVLDALMTTKFTKFYNNQLFEDDFPKSVEIVKKLFNVDNIEAVKLAERFTNTRFLNFYEKEIAHNDKETNIKKIKEIFSYK